MTTQARILAWRIPWIEEPGGLQSMGLRSQTQLKLLSIGSTCMSVLISQFIPPPLGNCMPPLPLGNCICFLHLGLNFCFVNRFICTMCLYFTYKWYHMIFSFSIWLTSLRMMQVYPYHCKWHYFILFNGWVIYTYIFFIHSSVNGHLDCFHALII